MRPLQLQDRPALLVPVETVSPKHEYAARTLFAPLGIQRWFWKRSPSGLVDTEGGLYLEARDLAKIWYLFLQGGKWEGKTIVSPFALSAARPFSSNGLP